MSKLSGLTLEVLAHYPREDDPNKGTLHVRWVEYQIELRGCPYWLKDYRVYLPGHKGVKDGKACHYPAISFANPRRQQEFQLQLRSCWKAYAKAKGLRFKQPSPRAAKPRARMPSPKGLAVPGEQRRVWVSKHDPIWTDPPARNWQ